MRLLNVGAGFVLGFVLGLAAFTGYVIWEAATHELNQ